MEGGLKEEFQKPYWEELTKFVRKQYLSNKVYPPAKNIFRLLIFVLWTKSSCHRRSRSLPR